MKKVLWKPSRITWQIHVVIAIFAIVGIIIIEVFQVNIRQPYYKQKTSAARTMRKSIEALKKHRMNFLGAIDKRIDPTESGLIGIISSPITSKEGSFDAKLMTINPNWAAVMVLLLKKAGARTGNTVAVSFSGSFPALNLAVLAAAKTLNLRLIVISSASSSSWGANIPGFSWLEMEEELYKKGLFPYRSVAASLGGVKDNAIGMPEKGRMLLKEIIRQRELSLLEFENIEDDIETRMGIYRERAGDYPIAVYVNVGGGITAFGSLTGKRLYRPGLNLRPPRRAILIDSVMSRFAREGIPIIYITKIKTLAKKYGLSINHKTMPKIGIGEIYYKAEYNKVLVTVVLILLLLLLYVFIRMGLGYRIFETVQRKGPVKPPEPMI